MLYLLLSYKLIFFLLVYVMACNLKMRGELLSYPLQSSLVLQYCDVW